MSTHTPYPCPTTPPHCPNPACRFHYPQPTHWPYELYGSYPRQKPPLTVQRYRCQACHRTFSDQTFRTTYWLKCPEYLPEIQKHAVSGASNRQVARLLGCAPGTVDNHLARLGRHCILYQRHMLEDASPFVDIAVDGLVTFEYSQYHPYEIIAAVDRNTSFFIHTMTEYQKKRREIFESCHLRADPQSVMKAMVEVLSTSLDGALKAHVWSDKHKVYPHAIRRIRFCEITHSTVDSRAKRTRQNPLFEINCLDMLIRHCLKDHTRETIGFGKRRQHSIYRLAIFLVWRNYIKLRREKRCRSTPAMLLGLTERALTEQEILAKRPLPVNLGHELRYAA